MQLIINKINSVIELTLLHGEVIILLKTPIIHSLAWFHTCSCLHLIGSQGQLYQHTKRLEPPTIIICAI